MLALALERLRQTNQRPDRVELYADTQANLDDIEYVRDEYYPEAMILHAREHIATPSGTWNILQAIKQGCLTGANLIFLVEEDVMVRPNFFEWHYEQMATGKYLATCGRLQARMNPRWQFVYTNPGACLRRELVEKLIPHICDEYFGDPRGYLLKHFEPWEEMSILDDGLIRRVIRQTQGEVLIAQPGVCVHQGFKFYNHIDIYMNPETKIQDKIEYLRELLLRVRPTDRYARDFEPY